jgi:AmmeMemoRadiSam system protein B
MNLRENSLPPGWYPRNEGEIARFLSDFNPGKGGAPAVIAPHAGWYYSGRIAAAALSCLDSDAQTVAIIGGHLPSGMPPLFALEDAVKTPLGPMSIDSELRELLIQELKGREDRYRDNTVEVLLPMVRYFFPRASLIWIRLPAEIESFEAGKTIARCAQKLKRRICVAASTDLTHYGDNYGFSPRGRGEKALKWVTEVNDARFIQAVLEAGPDTVLQRAEKEFSSCSPGAVLGALGFAEVPGKGARLLEYSTSAAREEECPDSFVGYAAIAFG